MMIYIDPVTYINLLRFTKVDTLSPTSEPSAKFTYWHSTRLGKSQGEISQQQEITRQAVSKAIKSQERDILERMLNFAQAIGVLVEWYDVSLGILIGITPQLENRTCLIFIDDRNQVLVFYDQEGYTSDKFPNEMAIDRINETLHTNLEKILGFKEIATKLTDR